MKRNIHRWLFASVFAAVVLAVGWLLVDASSPIALGAEVVEDGWYVANLIPLLLAVVVTNREHDTPALVAIPFMLCWWIVVGLGISHLIWRRVRTAPNGPVKK